MYPETESLQQLIAYRGLQAYGVAPWTSYCAMEQRNAGQMTC
jgi:hypothetical protein